ncbi:MAG: 30S ribosomal protein S5 [Nitrospirae bacterium]|nr:30S ribosomal protein S5 [Nitrospirota bacterium]
MGRIDPEGLNLKEKVVYINRVAKVVKGGRRFSFSAIVVVGDGEGYVGAGKGKGAEVPVAIKKAVGQAKRRLIRVPLKEGTIPHQIEGKYGAVRIVMKPAKQGRGIIAGGGARAVMEVAGIHNVVAKAIGSHNPFNTVKATIDGLMRLRSFESISERMAKASEDADKSGVEENA